MIIGIVLIKSVAAVGVLEALRAGRLVPSGKGILQVFGFACACMYVFIQISVQILIHIFIHSLLPPFSKFHFSVRESVHLPFSPALIKSIGAKCVQTVMKKWKSVNFTGPYPPL